MKKIIIVVSLLLSACSSSPMSSTPMTPVTRAEAIQNHETSAEKARKRGQAIANAPAAPNSQQEMNKAYDDVKRHTLRAAVLKEDNSVFSPFIGFFLSVFK